MENNIEINKSSRHQKIIGYFGESIFCNWLSRSGFEVTIVDHTGIDIVAYNPIQGNRLGISVKSRTRNIGKEFTTVNVISRGGGKNDLDKITNACQAFACEPWLGIYVETSLYADLYLTSLNNFLTCYSGNNQKMVLDWKMSSTYIRKYDEDKAVKHIRINFNPTNWNMTVNW